MAALSYLDNKIIDIYGMDGLQTFKKYGIAGVYTLKYMREALPFPMDVTFDKTADRFVVLGSSELKKEVIEKIFADKHYVAWAPKVLDEPDGSNNRLVRFVICPIGEQTGADLMEDFLRSGYFPVKSGRPRAASAKSEIAPISSDL
jgi:hypothetical protein